MELTTSKTEKSATQRVVLLPHGIGANLYVRELGRAYVQNGSQVVYGAENLAESGLKADLLHLQWPEEHYRWTGQGTPEARANHFISQLHGHKRAGTLIVWTVHNLMPHEHQMNELDKRVYQAVIDCAAIIVHHCALSQKLLAEQFSNTSLAHQMVLPHGHFQAYGPAPDQAIARQKLKIPNDAFVYLHFGQVRAYKGLETLLAAFPLVKSRSKYLVVAGKYRALTERDSIWARLKMLWLKKFARRVGMFLHEIPNEEVPMFMSAADAVVLSHSAGLNSGVAVLGMTYGKPVIGPGLGCIADVLQQGANLVYPADDVVALSMAMTQAADLDLKHVAHVNAAVAQSWEWTTIVEKILTVADARQ